jgi:TolB protein
MPPPRGRSCSRAPAAATADIYAIDPAGGVPTQLTDSSAIDAEPEWFPNGDRIAFSSSRTGTARTGTATSTR